MKTWVFAGGDSVKGMAPDLLSRFHVVHMEPHTKEEFVIPARHMLSVRENTAPETPTVIADTASRHSLDVGDYLQYLHFAMRTVNPWQTDGKTISGSCGSRYNRHEAGKRS